MTKGEWREERKEVEKVREVPRKGCCNHCPCKCLYLGSSGWIATAVSPNIVSGRVVETTISEPSGTYEKKKRRKRKKEKEEEVEEKRRQSEGK